MTDGFISNIPPAVPAGTLTNPVAPDAQVPSSTAARLLDSLRNTNGAGMVSYNALLVYPLGTVGRAILDAGLGTAPWGNITGTITNQTDLMAQFTIRDNNLAAHVANVSNPHAVTKAQVGLSNVDNTADLSKPVSTLQQNALDLKLNINNPTATGILTVPAGTTSVAPVSFQAGSLLTAPVNHRFEWDGTWLNITNNATVRKRLALLDTGTNLLPTSQGGTGTSGQTALGLSLLTAANAAAALVILGATGRLIGVQTFLANGTYTPTSGTNSIVVEALGAGGGAGGSAATGASTVSVGIGGGAGGRSLTRLTSGFAGASVVVGAAGSGGGIGASGGNGGTSSFGSGVCQATGGTGGVSTAASGNPGSGGVSGGVGTLGNIANLPGQASDAAFGVFAQPYSVSGAGGTCPYGSAGTGQITVSNGGNAGGVAASGFGAGGSGSVTGSSNGGAGGGAGAPGIVIIYEYS